jgi:hypothetical protein
MSKAAASLLSLNQASATTFARGDLSFAATKDCKVTAIKSDRAVAQEFQLIATTSDSVTGRSDVQILVQQRITIKDRTREQVDGFNDCDKGQKSTEQNDSKLLTEKCQHDEDQAME